MCTAEVPVAHSAVQTSASAGTVRISQSLQTWISPGEPTNGPATMCTSTGLIVSPSTAGSVIAGGEGVAETAAAAIHANAAAAKKARRQRGAGGRARRRPLAERPGNASRSITAAIVWLRRSVRDPLVGAVVVGGVAPGDAPTSPRRGTSDGVRAEASLRYR